MKTSRMKFPRRVRIHGGECGAVARALHHEAKSLSLPAVKENVFFTTHERKSMSTKTFFKRIATTLAISLGVSVLSLAPAAQANKDNGGGVSASCVMRSGVGAVITVTPTKWGTADVVVRAKGSSYTLSGATAYGEAAAFNGAGTTVVLSTQAVSDTVTGVVIPLTGDTAATTVATLTYTIWADYAGNNASSPGTDEIGRAHV